MGKRYWCVNCEERNVHDKQRHHYQKHLNMPYKDNFFKPVCDYKNITKIKCLLCGYIIESDQYNKKMKIHAQIFHPEMKHLSNVFDPAKALKCIAIKCKICIRFIEEDRLIKFPKCPHGSLYEDPNDSLVKTDNEWPNETRKWDATNDITVRELNFLKKSVEMEATLTTVEREPSDEGFTTCNICRNIMKTSNLEKHMRRQHLEKAIDLDSDSEQDEKPIIKVEKDAGHSTVATNQHLEKAIDLDQDSKHDDKPKIKIEKNITVATPTPIPKEIPSNELNETNQEPSDSETEFYPLRISKSELERFLLAKRIYPRNGNFYLKDS